MEDIADLAHCWFFGEVSDHFVPWAYPYNWREAGESVGTKGSPFRNPTGTCQFGMADGRVVLVAGSEGVAFLQASAKIVPTVEGRSALEHALSRSVPPRHYSATTAASARTCTVLHSRPDDSTKEGVSVVAYHTVASPNREIVWVHVRSGKEWSREQVLDAVHAGCQWRSDEITHVSLPFLSEASVDALRKLPSLRWIVADSMDDHPATLQSLSHLKTLTNLTIRQTATPALHERLQRALPKCQIAWRPTQ